MGDIIYFYCCCNSLIIGLKCYIGVFDLSMYVMIYDIDYINWYMDSELVKVIVKSCSVLLKEYGMNDVIYVIVMYENGVIVCLEVCWVLLENLLIIIDDKFELVGIKGVVYVDFCDYGVCFVSEKGVFYLDLRYWYYINGEVFGDLVEEVMVFINNVVNNIKLIIILKEVYDFLWVVDVIECFIVEGKEVLL